MVIRRRTKTLYPDRIFTSPKVLIIEGKHYVLPVETEHVVRYLFAFTLFPSFFSIKCHEKLIYRYH